MQSTSALNKIIRFDFGALQDFSQPKQEKPVVAESQPELVEHAPPPPPPPTFSETDLMSAKKDSFIEGMEAGEQKGYKKAQSEDVERNRHIETMLEQITANLSEIKANHQEWLTYQNRMIQPLVMMICRKVAGDAMSQLPEPSVEALVKECLPIIYNQPHFTLTVHPSVQKALGKRLPPILEAAGIEGDLTITSKETILPSDAALEWVNGHANRSVERLWMDIEQKLRSVDFTHKPAGKVAMLDEQTAIMPSDEAGYQPSTTEIF